MNKIVTIIVDLNKIMDVKQTFNNLNSFKINIFDIFIKYQRSSILNQILILVINDIIF